MDAAHFRDEVKLIREPKTEIGVALAMKQYRCFVSL